VKVLFIQIYNTTWKITDKNRKISTDKNNPDKRKRKSVSKLQ